MKQTAIEWLSEQIINAKHTYKLRDDLENFLLENAKKWQKERMYSEKDLKEAWEDGRKFEHDHNGGEGGEFTGAESFEEWFELFKKK